jgi:pyruvate, water dikinase
MEFVISNAIRVHPLALTRFDQLKDAAARDEIERLTAGYADKAEYFVDTLARGLSRIAAVMHPRPVIVRMSDFKTNEYARASGRRRLRAGRGEPDDRLPRRRALLFAERLCRRLRAGMPRHRRLREEMGFDNVRRDDPLLPHPRGGRPRAGRHGRGRAASAARTGCRSM